MPTLKPRQLVFVIIALTLGILLLPKSVLSWLEVSPTTGAQAASLSVTHAESILPADQGELAPTKSAPKLRDALQATQVKQLIDKLTPEQMFCYLKQNGIEVPASGDVRIMQSSLNDGDRYTGMAIVVSSSECPPDHYSYISIRRNGQIERNLDCRQTNLAELTLELSYQGNVNETPKQAGEVNLAISGGGRFVKFCEDQGFLVTRDGRFHVDEEGYLRSVEGCLVWGDPTDDEPEGGPIGELDGQSPNSEGCFENGACVAAINAAENGIKNFSFVDSKNMLADLGLKNMAFDRESTLFTDSLEDLDNPDRSPTGITRIETWPRLIGTPECREPVEIDWNASPDGEDPQLAP